MAQMNTAKPMAPEEVSEAEQLELDKLPSFQSEDVLRLIATVRNLTVRAEAAESALTSLKQAVATLVKEQQSAHADISRWSAIAEVRGRELTEALEALTEVKAQLAAGQGNESA